MGWHRFVERIVAGSLLDLLLIFRPCDTALFVVPKFLLFGTFKPTDSLEGVILPYNMITKHKHALILLSISRPTSQLTHNKACISFLTISIFSLNNLKSSTELGSWYVPITSGLCWFSLTLLMTKPKLCPALLCYLVCVTHKLLT